MTHTISRLIKPIMWTAAGTGMAGLAHSAPAFSSVLRLRPQYMPKLSGLGRPGHVALTFDDGPDSKSTPAFLEELNRLGWKATFFLLGVMVKRNPTIPREIVDAGHEIALHGFEHRNHLWCSPRWVHSDLRRGYDAVTEHSGVAPAYFRPPYGVLSTMGIVSARMIGVKPMLWSAWGKDWTDSATPETVAASLINGAERIQGDYATQSAGPTLLLHDSDCTSEIASWKSALGSLRYLSEWVEENQLSVGPLRDHF